LAISSEKRTEREDYYDFRKRCWKEERRSQVERILLFLENNNIKPNHQKSKAEEGGED